MQKIETTCYNLSTCRGELLVGKRTACGLTWGEVGGVMSSWLLRLWQLKTLRKKSPQPGWRGALGLASWRARAVDAPWSTERESPWNIRESQDERHMDRDMGNKPRCI